jgi:hypothetical protein
MHLDAVTFWLLTAAAAQTSGRNSQAAGCNVAGFEFKPKQLPQALSSPDAAVVYTFKDNDTAHLQVTPDVAATAAACKRNYACAMFTSEGLTLGVRREIKTVDAAIVLEQLGGGPFLWVPMQNCSGRCCGTWVAEDLQQQLVNPSEPPIQDIALPVTDVLKRQYLRALKPINLTESMGTRESSAASSSGSLD